MSRLSAIKKEEEAEQNTVEGLQVVLYELLESLKEKITSEFDFITEIETREGHFPSGKLDTVIVNPMKGKEYGKTKFCQFFSVNTLYCYGSNKQYRLVIHLTFINFFKGKLLRKLVNKFQIESSILGYFDGRQNSPANLQFEVELKNPKLSYQEFQEKVADELLVRMINVKQEFNELKLLQSRIDDQRR